MGLAIVVLAIGYGYDLLAKGTAWSWFPFAIGIPLLPLYGWSGVGQDLPGWFAVMLPMAGVAGAAIAVTNARVDLERDTAAGTTTVATVLGLELSWRVGLTLWVGAGLLALGSLAATGGTPGESAVVGIGLAVVLAAAVAGRHADPGARERSWEIQAVAAAGAAIAWLAAIA